GRPSSPWGSARLERCAARLVLGRELEQQRVELRPLGVAQRLEEVVLQLSGQRAQPAQRALALRRHLDEVAAAVVRVALALDEASLLELVEEADELPSVVSERIRDRPLRLVRAFVQRDQDRMMV